jgi:hypothetical protein
MQLLELIHGQLDPQPRQLLQDSAARLISWIAKTHRLAFSDAGFDLTRFFKAVARTSSKLSPISELMIQLAHQMSESHENHPALLRSGILPQIMHLQTSEIEVQKTVRNMMNNPVAALEMYDQHLLGTRAEENMSVARLLLLRPSSPPTTQPRRIAQVYDNRKAASPPVVRAQGMAQGKKSEGWWFKYIFSLQNGLAKG